MCGTKGRYLEKKKKGMSKDNTAKKCTNLYAYRVYNAVLMQAYNMHKALEMKQVLDIHLNDPEQTSW